MALAWETYRAIPTLNNYAEAKQYHDSTTDQWYANFSHFGRTTSKHKSQANPGVGMEDMIPLHGG